MSHECSCPGIQNEIINTYNGCGVLWPRPCAWSPWPVVAKILSWSKASYMNLGIWYKVKIRDHFCKKKEIHHLKPPSGKFVLSSAAFSGPAVVVSVTLCLLFHSVGDSWDRHSCTQMPSCYKVTRGCTSGPHLLPCFPHPHPCLPLDTCTGCGIATIENRKAFPIPQGSQFQGIRRCPSDYTSTLESCPQCLAQRWTRALNGL